jgi:hypothetical protein
LELLGDRLCLVRKVSCIPPIYQLTSYATGIYDFGDMERTIISLFAANQRRNRKVARAISTC